VGGVQRIDHFALDIGMKNLDVNAQAFGVTSNLLVDLLQGGCPENLQLDLAPHVHARTLDYQYPGH
jgi:hypothetical protein